MKTVAKYNVNKGVSTVLTIGTPFVTLACCGDLFIHRSDTAISAAAVFAILIAILFFKDKMMDKWKTPSALVLSIITLVFVLIAENLLIPLKYVSIASIIACTIDEFTFKRIYKDIENEYPNTLQKYKKFGFVFTSTDVLLASKETE